MPWARSHGGVMAPGVELARRSPRSACPEPGSARSSATYPPLLANTHVPSGYLDTATQQFIHILQGQNVGSVVQLSVEGEWAVESHSCGGVSSRRLHACFWLEGRGMHAHCCALAHPRRGRFQPGAIDLQAYTKLV